MAGGTQLTLTYNDEGHLDKDNPPDLSAFTVKVDNKPVAISENGIRVDTEKNTVLLRLDKPVLQGQKVVLSYIDPRKGDDANAIQDEAGHDAATIKNIAVDNTDTTAPVLMANTGDDNTRVTANKTRLVMSYSDDSFLDDNPPPNTAFTVKADGKVIDVTAVAIDPKAKTVTLTLDEPVLQDQVVKLSYTDPTTGNDANAIQDSNGNDAESVKDASVTNNTKDKTPPVFSQATVEFPTTGCRSGYAILAT